MRVRIEPYRAYAREQWRTTALFVAAGVLLVVAVLGAATGVSLWLFPMAGEPNDGVNGLVVIVIFGGPPSILGAVALWRAVLRRRRFRRFRDLVGLAQSTGTISVDRITGVLGLAALDAHRLVIDATELGFLEVPAEPARLDTSSAQFAPTMVASPSSSGGAVARPSGNPAQLVGAVLNATYQVEGFLGAGGMGAVYAARHLRTGRRYALKTLLADERLDPDALRRFEREATAASALGHPGIIAVHDFNRAESGVRYLTMDLLEGETLEQRVRRLGSLAWPDALRVAVEIGSALSAAHGAGLLHRDLKPANIFLAQSGGAERAVLLDFGLVKPLGPNATTFTATGMALGTPLYMAPEQARGEECDVRTDVHGLALVVFEMLSGVPPYFDTSLPSLLARLLTTPAPAVSSVARRQLPAGLDETLARALAKERDARYPTVAVFVHALQTVGRA